MVDEQLSIWLKEERGQEIIKELPISGGSISKVLLLKMSDGTSYFFKTNPEAPDGMFEAESKGLKLLAAGAGPRIPKVYKFSDSYILIEDMRTATKSHDWGARLGQALALMHQRKAKKFGLDKNNFIGSSLQVNTYTLNGFDFFAQHRLAFQNRMARNANLLSMSESTQIDKLTDRIEELIPYQAPALLHGDLWTGNAVSDEQGLPALIDPAVYYGWPEADIAMTVLFGGFGDDFYSAYQSIAHLEKAWRERLPLYNLYHLLNHLNLFGPSYHGQVMATTAQYS